MYFIRAVGVSVKCAAVLRISSVPERAAPRRLITSLEQMQMFELILNL